jgi:hypothetical protein
MESNQKTPDITEQLMDYIDTRIKLGRYKAIDKFTSIFAGLLTSAFVIICGMLAFFFASITLALYLSDVMQSFWQGFGIVALIYLVLALLVVMLKDRYLEPSIINTLVKKILKSKS